MTQTFEILNFGHWDLFEIWCLFFWDLCHPVPGMKSVKLMRPWSVALRSFLTNAGGDVVFRRFYPSQDPPHQRFMAGIISKGIESVLVIFDFI